MNRPVTLACDHEWTVIHKCHHDNAISDVSICTNERESTRILALQDHKISNQLVYLKWKSLHAVAESLHTIYYTLKKI